MQHDRGDGSGAYQFCIHQLSFLEKQYCQTVCMQDPGSGCGLTPSSPGDEQDMKHLVSCNALQIPKYHVDSKLY